MGTRGRRCCCGAVERSATPVAWGAWQRPRITGRGRAAGCGDLRDPPLQKYMKKSECRSSVNCKLGAAAFPTPLVPQ